MQDASYTYMYNYSIKYNVEFFIIIEYKNFLQHFVRGMFEKLARRLASWDAKLKHWHAIRHVGAFIGTLARKNEKLTHF